MIYERNKLQFHGSETLSEKKDKDEKCKDV